jgi:hypothetical protein
MIFYPRPGPLARLSLGRGRSRQFQRRRRAQKQRVRFRLDLLSNERRGHEGQQPEHGIATISLSKEFMG